MCAPGPPPARAGRQSQIARCAEVTGAPGSCCRSRSVTEYGNSAPGHREPSGMRRRPGRHAVRASLPAPGPVTCRCWPRVGTCALAGPSAAATVTRRSPRELGAGGVMRRPAKRRRLVTRGAPAPVLAGRHAGPLASGPCRDARATTLSRRGGLDADAACAAGANLLPNGQPAAWRAERSQAG